MDLTLFVDKILSDLSHPKRRWKLIGIIVGVIIGSAWISGMIGELMTSNTTDIYGNKMNTFNFFDIFGNLIKGFTEHGEITLMVFAVPAYIFFWLYSRTQLKPNEDERGFSYSQNGTYGTARKMRISEARDLLEFQPAEDQPGFIIGCVKETNETVGVVTEPQYEGDERPYKIGPHTIIFGASGARKSRSWAIPRIMQAIVRGESLILTDPKRELYNLTSKLLKLFGYTVKKLDLIEMYYSSTWDILAECIPEPGDFSRDLYSETLIFVDTLMANTRGTSSDAGQASMFEPSEKALIQACMLFVCSEFDEENRQFPDFYDFLMMEGGTFTDAEVNDTTLTGKFNTLAQNKPEHPALPLWRTFMNSSPNLRGNIAASAKARLGIFAAHKVKSILSRSTDQIDLLKPGIDKCAYFVVMSDQDTTFAPITSLFFSIMFQKLVRFADKAPGAHLPRKIHVLGDEFANIGVLPDFDVKISTLRSRWISISMIFQNIQQVFARYGKEGGGTIISNCDTQVFLGGNDPETTKYFSEQSGDATIDVHTHSYGTKAVGVGSRDNDLKESAADGKRKVYTPDEVKNISPDKLLLLIRGQYILELDKFDYSGHPMAKKMDPIEGLGELPEWRKEQLKQMYEDGELEYELYLKAISSELYEEKPDESYKETNAYKAFTGDIPEKPDEPSGEPESTPRTRTPRRIPRRRSARPVTFSEPVVTEVETQAVENKEDKLPESPKQKNDSPKKTTKLGDDQTKRLAESMDAMMGGGGLEDMFGEMESNQ